MTRAKLLSLCGVAVLGAAALALPPKYFNSKVRLTLPPTIYAVPGMEMNVYYANVVLAINAKRYQFEVLCPKGKAEAERWTFKPTAADVGEFPFEMRVRDKSRVVVAYQKTMVRVAPANAGAGKSIVLLAIGDSVTRGSRYTRRLYKLCEAPGNPKLKLIGTRGPKSEVKNRHEGLSGWTATGFATRYRDGVRHTGDRAKDGSPFVYKGADGKLEVDFAAYCRDVNGGQAPDFVTIFLGINDVFSANDGNIKARVDRMFKYYDILIAAIHEKSKATKIGVVLVPPPSASQDAFGANYGCKQTRWQYVRNQHALVERMLQHYGGREKENIFIVPTTVNIDCAAGYPRRKTPVNARTKKTGWRWLNGVHPSWDGHKQIGDTLYCWVKAELAKP